MPDQNDFDAVQLSDEETGNVAGGRYAPRGFTAGDLKEAEWRDGQRELQRYLNINHVRLQRKIRSNSGNIHSE